MYIVVYIVVDLVVVVVVVDMFALLEHVVDSN